MSTTPTPSGGSESEYALGPVHPNTQSYATLETKPSTVYADWTDGNGDLNTRRDTGGGYARWRSTELRPETTRQSKEDVYVPVHRLSAVAWCYPDDMTVGEILQHLDGRDVHHTTGVEWANFGDSPNFPEEGVQVCGHGRHSEITQSQMRAWAEDAKRRAEDDGVGQMSVDSEGREGVCSGCGASEGPTATTDSLEESYCLECVTERAGDGDVIEVL